MIQPQVPIVKVLERIHKSEYVLPAIQNAPPKQISVAHGVSAVLDERVSDAGVLKIARGARQ